MSMECPEKITCPDCGTEGDFTIWRSVNTQLSPEAKKRVLNGEIFKFKCPKCGNVSNVVYDMLYHQMEDEIMIHLATEDDAVDEAAESFDKIANGTMMPGIDLQQSDYTFRIVRDQNQLREKIYIFDQGLDDRIIELMKMFIISNLMVKQPEIKIKEMLLEINEGAPENFAVQLEDGTWGSFPFQQEFYDTVKNDPVAPDDDGKRNYFVNRGWALEHLEARIPK